MCVILGSALPGRLVAVTVLSVVVPLYMSELQQPPAIAGRVLLLYFLCFASTATLVAHWSDLLGRRKPFIVFGGVLSVAACLSLPLLGGVWGMAACCALLGFGQALQSSPQIALTTEVFEHQPESGATATPEQALAAFRLIERVGSIIAPFVTAVAVTAFGYAGAVVAVGVLLTVATVGLAAGLRVLEREGVANALVNGGGDVLASGRLQGRPWRVGVRDPRAPEKLLGAIEVEGFGIVASSGDYERGFMHQGRRLHHVLDPQSGWPTSGVHGVALLARDVRAVNGWGTALMVQGMAAVPAWSAGHPDVAVLAAGSDGALWQSRGMAAALKSIAA